jgi:hypothetical protein
MFRTPEYSRMNRIIVTGTRIIFTCILIVATCLASGCLIPAASSRLNLHRRR